MTGRRLKMLSRKKEGKVLPKILLPVRCGYCSSTVPDRPGWQIILLEGRQIALPVTSRPRRDSQATLKTASFSFGVPSTPGLLRGCFNPIAKIIISVVAIPFVYREDATKRVVRAVTKIVGHVA